MQRDLALVYPQLADVAVEHAWSGRMGFARHKMPLIRELAPGLWVNTCFGGHGLNTTTLGGELVASALAEGDRRWKLLAPFAPRWVGGALGPLAAQAIYGRARLQDAARAWRDRRRSRRRPMPVSTRRELPCHHWASTIRSELQPADKQPSRQRCGRHQRQHPRDHRDHHQ